MGATGDLDAEDGAVKLAGVLQVVVVAAIVLALMARAARNDHGIDLHLHGPDRKGRPGPR
jgi:hypothetical protein